MSEVVMSPNNEGDIPLDDHGDGEMDAAPNTAFPAGSDDDDDDEEEEGENWSEEDDGHLQSGYQLLAQDPEPTIETEPDQMYVGDEEGTPSSSAPELPPPLSSCFQTPSQDLATVVMYRDSDEERESRKQVMAGDDQIKQAMAGFMLPTTAVPQWANFVSEDDWKKQIFNQMERTDDCDTNSKENLMSER